MLKNRRKVSHRSVGFPLSQGTKDFTKNEFIGGINFQVGLNGLKGLDDSFIEEKAKRFDAIYEPSSEFPGDMTFAKEKPDSYAITFFEQFHRGSKPGGLQNRKKIIY